MNGAGRDLKSEAKSGLKSIKNNQAYVHPLPAPFSDKNKQTVNYGSRFFPMPKSRSAIEKVAKMQEGADCGLENKGKEWFQVKSRME